MVDGMLPPFGEPAGERVDDAAVLTAFLRGEAAFVHSGRFHLEGQVLVVGGDLGMSIRIAPRTFLLRTDLPANEAEARIITQEAMTAAGLSCLDEETLLAAPVAIQHLGLRQSLWDLWGADIDESFADLRASAAGEWDDLFPEGPPPMAGPEE